MAIDMGQGVDALPPTGEGGEGRWEGKEGKVRWVGKVGEVNGREGGEGKGRKGKGREEKGRGEINRTQTVLFQALHN